MTNRKNSVFPNGLTVNDVPKSGLLAIFVYKSQTLAIQNSGIALSR
jgi:hypothetical protein